MAETTLFPIVIVSAAAILGFCLGVVATLATVRKW